MKDNIPEIGDLVKLEWWADAVPAEKVIGLRAGKQPGVVVLDFESGRKGYAPDSAWKTFEPPPENETTGTVTVRNPTPWYGQGFDSDNESDAIEAADAEINGLNETYETQMVSIRAQLDSRIADHICDWLLEKRTTLWSNWDVTEEDERREAAMWFLKEMNSFEDYVTNLQDLWKEPAA